MKFLRPGSDCRLSLPLLLAAVGIAVPCVSLSYGRQSKVDVLRIGSTGSLVAPSQRDQEKGALNTLQSLIKDETGLDNEVIRQQDWRELADKMAQRKLQLGIFQGYEFAWAQAQDPRLKPLALAVNVHRYLVVYVVVRRDNRAKDFAGLKGQSACLPETNQPYLRLFLERQCELNGEKMEKFFSKITSPDNIEDALDDVVDGVVQAAVFDRAALEAYKRRKPARFKQLKAVVQSQPLSPVVIAYQGSVLDETTIERFRNGLLGASSKEKSKTVLNQIFRITGFEKVPDDFEKVLADMRARYPTPKK